MLTTDSLKRIDREVAKYPPDQKKSAVMSALVIAQDEKGWLSNEVMDYVAQYLGMAPVVLVNNKKMHDYMSNEKLDKLIDSLK